MGRAPCCDKANVKKGPWSPEEDAKLKAYIEQHGTGGNWIALPQKIGLKRCGKSCRLRWLNYLRPNIKHGGFSEEEDNIICSLYITIGSRWSIIAAQLPGRTDNDIKNYWNTRLKKKLLGKQRKDYQPASRAAKQQMKKAEDGGLTVGGGLQWTELHMPVSAANPLDRGNNDDHASIRKLLIKLGGRFSTDIGQRSSVVIPSQHIYGDPMSLMVPPFNEGCSSMASQPMENLSGFGTELDEIFKGESVKIEGLDCFYGMESNMVEGSSGASSSTSINWSEVSPLIYPTMYSSYQGVQQCPFEEPVHLGTQ